MCPLVIKMLETLAHSCLQKLITGTHLPVEIYLKGVGQGRSLAGAEKRCFAADNNL